MNLERCYECEDLVIQLVWKSRCLSCSLARLDKLDKEAAILVPIAPNDAMISAAKNIIDDPDKLKQIYSVMIEAASNLTND